MWRLTEQLKKQSDFFVVVMTWQATPDRILLSDAVHFEARACSMGHCKIDAYTMWRRYEEYDVDFDYLTMLTRTRALSPTQSNSHASLSSRVRTG